MFSPQTMRLKLLYSTIVPIIASVSFVTGNLLLKWILAFLYYLLMKKIIFPKLLKTCNSNSNCIEDMYKTRLRHHLFFIRSNGMHTLCVTIKPVQEIVWAGYQMTGTDLAISDNFLSEEWYRFQSGAGNDMVTSAPSIAMCGTLYPVWLDGKVIVDIYIILV